jgi:hypothetical protein
VPRTVGPGPRVGVVVQHARHDVLLVRAVASESLALLVVVVGHVQAGGREV